MVLDLELFFRLLLNGHQMLGTNKKLFYYRRHSNNVTKKFEASGLRFSEESKLFKQTASQCSKKEWFITSLLLSIRLSSRVYRLYTWFREVYLRKLS